MNNTLVLTLSEIATQYQTQYRGTDFLQKLAALKPVFFSSATPLIQAVASGQVAWSPSLAPGFIAAGLPVKYGAVRNVGPRWGRRPGHARRPGRRSPPEVAAS